jgi:hypothetical protein
MPSNSAGINAARRLAVLIVAGASGDDDQQRRFARFNQARQNAGQSRSDIDGDGRNHQRSQAVGAGSGKGHHQPDEPGSDLAPGTWADAQAAAIPCRSAATAGVTEM